MIGDMIYGDQPYQHAHRPISTEQREPTAAYIAAAVADVLDALDSGQFSRAVSVVDKAEAAGFGAFSQALDDQLISAGQRQLSGQYAAVTS